MIGRGAALLEDLDIATAPLRDGHEHLKEIVAGYVARATASHQYSARLKHVDRQPIQAVIRPQGVVDRRAAAGELGRIKNDVAEAVRVSGWMGG